MSAWTHSICSDCYAAKEPGRVPFKVKDAPEETCCFCGEKAQGAIYYRYDPKELRCKGLHQPGGELIPGGAP